MGYYGPQEKPVSVPLRRQKKSDLEELNEGFALLDNLLRELGEAFCGMKTDPGQVKLRADLNILEINFRLATEENIRLLKEIRELTDPDRISVDHQQWLDTQRKIKKLGWLWRLL